MVPSTYTLLSNINSPSDVKKLKEEELISLCEELRRYIIEITSNNPGHLGASLGTIELTVAIHYVFDTPNDKLVWDVGHQAYAHKILTGRRDDFVNNRKYKGISGFPVLHCVNRLGIAKLLTQSQPHNSKRGADFSAPRLLLCGKLSFLLITA